MDWLLIFNCCSTDNYINFIPDSIESRERERTFDGPVGKAIGVKYVPGMRYCMFIASSRILSPRKQIAAALNKIALTNDQPTPTQATTYDQSYEISELSFRT